MHRMKYYLLSLLAVTVVSISQPPEAVAQVDPSVAKMAKDFGVSPDMLSKFAKSGLSAPDIGEGLKMAKEISGIQNLDISEVAERVLSLREGGADWPDIAKEFGMELPEGLGNLLSE